MTHARLSDHEGRGIDQAGPDDGTDGPTATSGGGAGTVGLGPRFGAKVMDWIPLVGIMFLMVGAALSVALEGAALTPDNLEEMQARLASSLALRIANVTAGVLPGLYFTIAEGLTGRTLGKQILGLSVTGPEGVRPGLAASFRRNLWHFALLLPAWLGPVGTLTAAISIAISISADDRGQGWHDRFGETSVVRSP